MNSISCVALVVHLFVVATAFRFFSRPLQCRNSDTAVVAAIAALSMGVLLMHLVSWGWHVKYDQPETFTDTVLGAISFVNGLFYLALVRLQTGNLCSRKH